jgi:hypothetical protein
VVDTGKNPGQKASQGTIPTVFKDRSMTLAEKRLRFIQAAISRQIIDYMYFMTSLDFY